MTKAMISYRDDTPDDELPRVHEIKFRDGIAIWKFIERGAVRNKKIEIERIAYVRVWSE